MPQAGDAGRGCRGMRGGRGRPLLLPPLAAAGHLAKLKVEGQGRAALQVQA